MTAGASGILQRLSGIAPRDLARRLDALLASDCETRPAFSGSWVVPAVPDGAVEVARYAVEGCPVAVYNLHDRTESLYHLTPPEYALSGALVGLVEGAREELLASSPATSSRPPRCARTRTPGSGTWGWGSTGRGPGSSGT